jgi:type 1 glutamine amidotransferase
MIKLTTTTTLVALLALAASAQARPAKRKVLFFTKAAGNEHAVIKVVDGQPSHAQKILQELGEKNGFEVTHTKDGRVFTAEEIAKYDGFVFYTTGDLTTEGTDKQPPMTPAGKELLLESVRKGKAFIGIHVASATFHDPANRFADAGDKADPYIKMLGGEMIFHGQQQKGRAFCSDSKFPGHTDVKDGFELFEEWYSLKNLAKDMHVILWMATWSLMNTGKDSVYRRPPYPLSWARMHGKGRVFYTALGHREDVWANPMYQSMLVGGIKWALGDAKADIRPNLAAVTPLYAELPPNDQKAAPAAPTAAKAPTTAPAPAAPPR